MNDILWGYFFQRLHERQIAVIIVSYKLDTEMERILPKLTEYTADLYRKAGDYMKMGKWMMLRLTVSGYLRTIKRSSQLNYRLNVK